MFLGNLFKALMYNLVHSSSLLSIRVKYFVIRSRGGSGVVNISRQKAFIVPNVFLWVLTMLYQVHERVEGVCYIVFTLLHKVYHHSHWYLIVLLELDVFCNIHATIGRSLHFTDTLFNKHKESF